MTIEQYVFLSIMLLLTMIYFHIRDDFNQGEFLSTYKQRDNWLKHEIGKKELYQNDYKVCLLIHSFKWSFHIMIPLFVFMLLMDSNQITVEPYGLLGFILIWLIGNTIFHYKIDDAKANKFKINLVMDQGLHILQIFGLWITTVAMYLGRLINH